MRIFRLSALLAGLWEHPQEAAAGRDLKFHFGKGGKETATHLKKSFGALIAARNLLSTRGTSSAGGTGILSRRHEGGMRAGGRHPSR